MGNANDRYVEIEEVHRWAFNHFRYVADDQRWKDDPNLVFNEHWETKAELEKDLDTKGYVEGDCDAFAMMCWLALRRAGIKSRLVLCTVEDQGHLVCEHEGWILDNRFAYPMTNTELATYYHYKFISKSGYEPGEEWTTANIG